MSRYLLKLLQKFEKNGRLRRFKPLQAPTFSCFPEFRTILVVTFAPFVNVAGIRDLAVRFPNARPETGHAVGWLFVGSASIANAKSSLDQSSWNCAAPATHATV